MKMSNIEPLSNYNHIIDRELTSEGPIAIFGVFNGKCAVDLAERYDRVVWAFDTFEGMPSDDYIKELDYDNPPGKFKPTHDAYSYLASYLPKVIPIKGRFINTLEQLPTDLKFSLIYLDCDYYNSYKQVLDFLILNNNLSSDTLIISDDYRYCQGAKKAMDEFLQSTRLIEDIYIRYGDICKK